jgi:hypothetical protein
MRPNPKRSAPRVLGDDESTPDSFVSEVCDQAIRRFRAELADVETRDQVREAQAQFRVVDALVGEFQQSTASRDWTVPERRVRQLAGDAIGLSLEYQHDHGYEPEPARHAAVLECLQGERAREEIAEHERAFAAEAGAAWVDRGQTPSRGGGER